MIAMDEQLVADIIQWDVRNWSAALYCWDHQVDWPSVYECLGLGGRDGGPSLWLALKDKHVVCSDVEVNQGRAQRRHERHGITSKIEYAVIDTLHVPYENRFDVIAFKSILRCIGLDGRKDRQQQAVNQMHRALKPGGTLLFIENLSASIVRRLGLRAFIRWGTRWRYVALDEMHEFLCRFNRVQMDTVGVLGALGRTERQSDLLAMIDQAALSRLLPDRWHYVVYGIAEK
ncbi:MAG: methyltransferase domain-containing protein [Pirellulales bacterium]